MVIQRWTFHCVLEPSLIRRWKPERDHEGLRWNVRHPAGVTGEGREAKCVCVNLTVRHFIYFMGGLLIRADIWHVTVSHFFRTCRFVSGLLSVYFLVFFTSSFHLVKFRKQKYLDRFRKRSWFGFKNYIRFLGYQGKSSHMTMHLRG